MVTATVSTHLDTAETSLNDLPSAFAQRYNNDGYSAIRN